jgi:hypothetical protein
MFDPMKVNGAVAEPRAEPVEQQRGNLSAAGK